jgi:hypothetical protein
LRAEISAFFIYGSKALSISLCLLTLSPGGKAANPKTLVALPGGLTVFFMSQARREHEMTGCFSPQLVEFSPGLGEKLGLKGLTERHFLHSLAAQS